MVVLQNRDGGLLPEMDDGGDDCTTVGKPLLGKASVRRNHGTNQIGHTEVALLVASPLPPPPLLDSGNWHS